MNTFQKLTIFFVVLFINDDKLATATPLALETIEEALQPQDGSPAAEATKEEERRDVKSQFEVDDSDSWDHRKRIDPLEIAVNSEGGFQQVGSKHAIWKRVLPLPFSDEKIYPLLN